MAARGETNWLSTNRGVRDTSPSLLRFREAHEVFGENIKSLITLLVQLEDFCFCQWCHRVLYTKSVFVVFLRRDRYEKRSLERQRAGQLRAPGSDLLDMLHIHDADRSRRPAWRIRGER